MAAVNDSRPWLGWTLKALLITLMASGLLAGAPVLAQDDAAADGAKEDDTRRTGSMSEQTYRKFSEIQEMIDAEDFNGAKRLLDELKASPKLSPYELAQINNVYGFVYFSQENYQAAINAYLEVLKQPDIPQGLRDQTIYTLAQLYFTTENWSKAIELIRQWLATAENPGPDPYVLLGSAYYSLAAAKDKASASDWRAVVEPIEKAMQIARERDMEVKENWYLLLRVAYYEMNDLKKVRDILEILVVRWPKKEYWTMLSAMYGELNAESRQLAAYEAAYDQGLLDRSSELVQLAQLFMQAEVPYKAAQVMSQGLESGKIEKTSDNYRLLSGAWQLAGEDLKAIPALKEAARMSSDGELDVRLANSYLNVGEFAECTQAAERGLNRGGIDDVGNAYIILGMCEYERENLEAAKRAFRQAANYDQHQKNGRQWIQFIEREEERNAELQRALQQLARANAR